MEPSKSGLSQQSVLIRPSTPCLVSENQKLHRIVPNFGNCGCWGKYLKDNKHNSFHLTLKICWDICPCTSSVPRSSPFSSSFEFVPGKLFSSRSRYCPRTNIRTYFRAKWRLLFRYTMMVKPMKTLELHYPMIQVLIINNTELITGNSRNWFSFVEHYLKNKKRTLGITNPEEKVGCVAR